MRSKEIGEPKGFPISFGKRGGLRCTQSLSGADQGNGKARVAQGLHQTALAEQVRQADSKNTV